MMRIFKLLVIFFVILAAESFASYNIGDTVNDFTLNDCDGNPVSLYDYYWAENGGQQFVVLINFGEPW